MSKQTKKPVLLVPLLVVLPAVGYSADVDTSNWLCESCPFEEGYRAEVDAGGTYVSDDAARFGNGNGYDEDGGYVAVDGHGRYAKDGYRLDWYAEDLGLDSRVLEIDGGRQGVFGFSLGYSELPYRRFDTSETVFSRSGGDTLTLPGSWTPAATTGEMTDLAASLRREDIYTDREIIDVGADWKPAKGFRVFADFRRQTQEGVDIAGGSSFTQASLLPRWIDYETDQVDAGIEYSTGRGTVTLAYYLSDFSNNNASLTWDTPYTSSPGAEQLRMATAPDNEFQQVSLSGAYRAAVWDTVIAASVAIGNGEQDEALLPYTINPNVVTTPLPTSSLDGDVDTTNYAFTVTARPIPKARVKFAYRYDERDNKTAQWGWDRVIVDLFNSGVLEENLPYSFERTTFSLSGEIVVWNDLRLSAGWDYKEVDRDFQEVAEHEIDDGWGQVRWRPADWLDLRVKGGANERDIDRYNESVGISVGQNPLMRKYNLAYRYREYGELVASFAPVDSPVSLNTTIFYAEDRYNQSQLGLSESEELRVTLDINWTPSENSSLYALLGQDAIDAFQFGSEQFADRDWSAKHDDDFDHYGVGFIWRDADGKVDLRFDYNRGDGETRIAYLSGSGGQSSLPQLDSTLDSATLEASYRWNERFSATFDLRYEKFELDDYTLVSPATMPTVLTLGADPYDYDVWAVGLGLRYNFGGGEITLAD